MPVFAGFDREALKSLLVDGIGSAGPRFRSGCTHRWQP